MLCLFKKVFVVEGNIAAGKSTLLDLIQKNFSNVLVLQEPLEKWTNVSGENLLKLFYKDPKRWTFTFEFYTMFTKLCALQKALTSDAEIIVMERSIYSDKVFMAISEYYKKCNKVESEIFKEVYEKFLQNYVGLNGVIYLDTRAEICLERIKQRGREEEKDIDLEYLINLDKRLFGEIYEASRMLINGNYDLKKPQKVLQRIKEFFNK
jgi:deoxyadenosine/deoxycytidine kinase